MSNTLRMDRLDAWDWWNTLRGTGCLWWFFIEQMYPCMQLFTFVLQALVWNEVENYLFQTINQLLVQINLLDCILIVMLKHLELNIPSSTTTWSITSQCDISICNNHSTSLILYIQTEGHYFFHYPFRKDWTANQLLHLINNITRTNIYLSFDQSSKCTKYSWSSTVDLFVPCRWRGK